MTLGKELNLTGSQSLPPKMGILVLRVFEFYSDVENEWYEHHRDESAALSGSRVGPHSPA